MARDSDDKSSRSRDKNIGRREQAQLMEEVRRFMENRGIDPAQLQREYQESEENEKKSGLTDHEGLRHVEVRVVRTRRANPTLED